VEGFLAVTINGPILILPCSPFLSFLVPPFPTITFPHRLSNANSLLMFSFYSSVLCVSLGRTLLGFVRSEGLFLPFASGERPEVYIVLLSVGFPHSRDLNPPLVNSPFTRWFEITIVLRLGPLFQPSPSVTKRDHMACPPLTSNSLPCSLSFHQLFPTAPVCGVFFSFPLLCKAFVELLINPTSSP